MFLTTTAESIQERKYTIMAAQVAQEDSATWISRCHISYFLCKTYFCN